MGITPLPEEEEAMVFELNGDPGADAPDRANFKIWERNNLAVHEFLTAVPDPSWEETVRSTISEDYQYGKIMKYGQRSRDGQCPKQ